MASERLKDKVVIVTGGAFGIGHAYAVGMAKEGAKLVIADVNLDAARATAKELEALGAQALSVKTDVSNRQDTLDMARKTVERFGRIDVLINNAAVFGRVTISRVPFWEITEQEWDKVMAVNLRGAFLCTQAVFPQMKAQGGGKIINISSATFFSGAPLYVHYVTTKGGIIGMTRSLAREVGEFNINVNCIAPGSTLSEDASDKDALKRREKAAAGRALKRVQYPDDLVGAAIFLASSESDFITGQTIVVDGGTAMH